MAVACRASGSRGCCRPGAAAGGAGRRRRARGTQRSVRARGDAGDGLDVPGHVGAVLKASAVESAVARGVLACVSGGADSIAMLHALGALRDCGGGAAAAAFELRAVHFDHRQRGERASAGDETLVQEHCAALRVPCDVIRWGHADGSGDAEDGSPREPGGGQPAYSQAAARAWRYAEAERLADEHGLALIATGHHLDDNVETVLLKLTRGVSLANIRGMDVLRGRVVRPLLGLRKRELERWLADCGLQWADDPSNADATYARRNAVRHRLVPLLEELCGGEDALLARLEEATEQSIMLRAQLDETLAPSGGCGSRPQQPEQPGQQVASFDVREWKLLPGDLARLDALHSYVAQATAPAVPSYAQVRALMLMLDGERPDDAGRGALRGGRGVLTSVGRSAGARRPGGRWERALSGGQVARCAHGVLTVAPRTEALAGASAHCATPATAEGER